MALVDVVEQFVRLTGRFDLVADGWNDDWDDATDSLGARFYINRAQRILDRLQETPNSSAWHIVKPASGTYKLNMTNLRAMQEVWLVGTTDSTDTPRVKLPEVAQAKLWDNYTTIEAEQTAGKPTKWARYSSRQSPATEGVAYTTEQGTGHITVGSTSTLRGIIWNPPSDGTYTLHVKGLFYEPTLVDDTDTSWWTENADDVLVFAAKWLLENGYKNSEGSLEIQAALAPMLAELDKDLVEEQISDVHQIWG